MGYHNIDKGNKQNSQKHHFYFNGNMWLFGGLPLSGWYIFLIQVILYENANYLLVILTKIIVSINYWTDINLNISNCSLNRNYFTTVYLTRQC